MGLVHSEIEIINGGDLEMVRRNFMDKDEVKRMYVTMLVDSDAFVLPGESEPLFGAIPMKKIWI